MSEKLPSDPHADPAVPEEIGGARRADLVVRKLDRLENQRRRPDFDPAQLKPLAVKTKRPGNIRVDISSNMVRVWKDDTQPLLRCKWLPQSDQFYVSRWMLVRGEYQKKPNQFFADLEEAWGVCGENHVLPEEFQKAFSDAPPPVEWDFRPCEFDRLDCSFKYHGDNKKPGLPQLMCTVCGSIYDIGDDGKMSLSKKGEGPDANA